MAEPVAEIRYEGDARVRSYRRGTYLGDAHLEQLIERALAGRYSFGSGWRGFARVSIEFFDERPSGGDED